jgi:hypothetical protein
MRLNYEPNPKAVPMPFSLPQYLWLSILFLSTVHGQSPSFIPGLFCQCPEASFLFPTLPGLWGGVFVEVAAV